MKVKRLTRKRRGECVYCAKVGPVTSDHVPPRSLFPKDPPKNLVTVPCCLECNQAASMDDEYFRLVVAARDGLSEHPAVREILPKALRSLANPAKKGFRAAFLKGLREVPVYTASGLYAGRRGAYDVDLRRLDAVVVRVVKALLYKRNGRRLPDGYEVDVMSDDGLRNVSPKELAALRDRLAAVSAAGARTVFETPVFSYVAVADRGDPDTSAWLLNFYGQVSFAALTTRSIFQSGHGAEPALTCTRPHVVAR